MLLLDSELAWPKLKSMSSASMVYPPAFYYPPGKKGIVTRRESTGRSQPKLATDQELLVIQNNTGIFNGLMQIQFLRPLRPKALSATTAAVVLSQSSTNTKFIWAISPTKPNGGSIVQHTSFGSEAGNMFAKASAFTSAESNFVVNKDRENYVLLQYVFSYLTFPLVESS